MISLAKLKETDYILFYGFSILFNYHSVFYFFVLKSF